VRPNPRMQPTGRGGPASRSGVTLPVAKQWNRCGPEGLQLMRKSLGSSPAVGARDGTHNATRYIRPI